MNSADEKPSLPAGDSQASPVPRERSGRWAEASDATRAPSLDDWFTAGRFGVLLLLLVIAAFPDVMLGSHTFYHRDYGCFGYPLAHWHRESFWRGEVPLWNPLNNCGIPFLAQWNTMTFYPLSAIYVLFPLPWSLGYFCLAHLFLGGLGMFALARRWTQNGFAASIAGLAYALNGLMLHALMWPNNIAALGWMPWVVLTAERAWCEGGRRVPLAAGVGAAQVLAGAPEVILLTWLVTVGVWLSVGGLGSALSDWRSGAIGFVPPLTPALSPLRGEGESIAASRATRGKSIVRSGRILTFVAVTVVGLSAVQLFPFVDLLLHSQRDATFGGDAWSMPPWGILQFLVPLFGSTPSASGVFSVDQQQWTSSYYLGVATLALAALAMMRCRQPRVVALALMAALGVWLAMGEHGLLFAWCRKLVPLAGFVRFPIKFVMLTVFALPLLAAIAVQWWLRAPPSAARNRLLVGIGLALLVALGATVAWLAAAPTDGHSNARVQNGLVRALVLLLMLAGMSHLRRVVARGPALALRLGILGLLAFDLLTHMPRQNPTVMTDAYQRGAVQRDWTLPPEAGRAVVSPKMQAFLDYAANPNAYHFCLGQRRALAPNWNLLEGTATVGGFYSLYTRPQHDVWSLIYRQTNFPSGLADFLGAAAISSDTVLFGWKQRASAHPLVTAGQEPVFADAATTLREVANPAFASAQKVFLPTAAQAAVAVREPTDARRVSARWGTSELVIEIEAEQAALVTVAQTHYHWWKATVNGRPAPLWPANHAFQAFEVPAGRSVAILVYRDWAFRCGVLVSLATLAGCVALWLRSPNRRQSEEPTVLMP